MKPTEYNGVVINRTKLPPMLDFPDAPRGVLEDAALWKLRRLLRIRTVHALATNPLGLRLLDSAIVTCVADAIAAGAGDKARTAIEMARLR